MIPPKAKQEIVDLAVEDWTPLFDVTAVIREVDSSRSEDEQIEAARAFVLDLLSRGYVKLYYDCWAKTTEAHRHVEELSSSEISAEIWNRANWVYHERREPDERWVTISATPEGEQALLAGEFHA
ncbi:MAG: hypothetical protein KJZ54_15755 [Phycisphaerales bacterium]|nr:hypothetical protein [Phycisphaerales bacterium]